MKFVLFKVFGELEIACGIEFNEVGVLRGKLFV